MAGAIFRRYSSGMTTDADSHRLVFDPDLIRRYDQSGPRYTSYPTAVQFRAAQNAPGGFGETKYRVAAARSNERRSPLSLYFHLPFCDTVCFYCACNKIVTKNRSRTGPYLDRLFREIEMQAALFDPDRAVDQLHWGGGTPTFLSPVQMRALMDKTRSHFHLRTDDRGEYSIEVDPREAGGDTIPLLRELGFNRLSMGVQDFDPAVQRAVNRLQSEEQTFRVLESARASGFRSVSFDLIYGLPRQSVDSFAVTLDKVVAAGPDRLSVFNYAHLPELFKTQRQINAGELPSAAEKLAILRHTIERLTSAGYVYIGMDHFARPDDELAIAQRDGTLYRNFQGYSTHADCDLVAMGVTSIGMVADTYGQNLKSLDEYYRAIDGGNLAVFRGVELNDDDRLRREVITRLICHFRLDIDTIEKGYGISFQEYFASELAALRPMQGDGLVNVSEAEIRVTPSGKLLIRNICMVFDRYLNDHGGQRFSKVI